jgi:UrcA family protein
VNKYLLPLIALAASGIASAASQDVPSIVVRFGDLDLNTESGVSRLHKRIRNAAESVCGPIDTRILELRDAFDACVKDTMSNGVAAVAKGKVTVVASN